MFSRDCVTRGKSAVATRPPPTPIQESEESRRFELQVLSSEAEGNKVLERIEDEQLFMT